MPVDSAVALGYFKGTVQLHQFWYEKWKYLYFFYIFLNLFVAKNVFSLRKLNILILFRILL